MFLQERLGPFIVYCYLSVSNQAFKPEVKRQKSYHCHCLYLAPYIFGQYRLCCHCFELVFNFLATCVHAYLWIGHQSFWVSISNYLSLFDGSNIRRCTLLDYCWPSYDTVVCQLWGDAFNPCSSNALLYWSPSSRQERINILRGWSDLICFHRANTSRQSAVYRLSSGLEEITDFDQSFTALYTHLPRAEWNILHSTVFQEETISGWSAFRLRFFSTALSISELCRGAGGDKVFCKYVYCENRFRKGEPAITISCNSVNNIVHARCSNSGLWGTITSSSTSNKSKGSWRIIITWEG